MKETEFIHQLNELEKLLGTLKNQQFMGKVSAAAEIATISLAAGGTIFFCGNGGSAAECQHMAAEYSATLSSKNFRPGFPAIALSTDTSFLTAWSNDFGYDNVFARQVENLVKKNDVLMAYSTSGNSKNVQLACKVARSKQAKVIGLLGHDAGAIREFCDETIIVPSHSTPRIQECHTLVGHSICRQVEINLGY